MLGTQSDIHQIAERAREFHARMKSIKASVAPRSFEWYPYDSLANVLHLNRLLPMERALFSLQGGQQFLRGTGRADERPGHRSCALNGCVANLKTGASSPW